MLKKALEHRKHLNHLDNIQILPFKHKYLKDLNSLLESNGHPTAETRTLPKIGYIVYLNKTPIAAGFLRKLEPCYAQIDTLCSNKFLGSIVRHQGISMVVDTLISEAKRLKLEGIVCHTKDKGVLTRAEALGFHIIDEKIIGLPLRT